MRPTRRNLGDKREGWHYRERRGRSLRWRFSGTFRGDVLVIENALPVECFLTVNPSVTCSLIGRAAGGLRGPKGRDLRDGKGFSLSGRMPLEHHVAANYFREIN